MKDAKKKALACMLAAASLLAVGASGVAANAAGATDSTITLSGALDGHEFQAYQLGKYSDPVDSNNNQTWDSVQVTNAGTDATFTGWLDAALTDAKITVPEKYDQAGALAQDGLQATQLKSAAKALANAADKPAPVTIDGKTKFTAAAGADSLTLNMPSEGLYLIVDNNGLPIIIGTKIQGKDMDKSRLGKAQIKSTAMSLDKTADKTDVTVGSTVNFTASFTLPSKDAAATKFVYKDTPTGMTIDATKVTVKIDGTADTTLKAASDGKGGFTVDFASVLQTKADKAVEITYPAVITTAGAKNHGDIDATIDGKDDTVVPVEVTVASHEFILNKVATKGNSAVVGAGFKIQDKAADKWMKYASGKWSYATDEASATELTTLAADAAGKLGLQAGQVAFKGLGAGKYLVKETTVPDGFYKAVKPQFTVTIGADGGVTIGDESDPQLSDVNGNVVTVKNVNSPTALPQTGAFSTIMGVAGLLLIMGVGTAGIKTARTYRQQAA